MLKRLLGSKKAEVIIIKLHNEELRNLHSLPDIIKVIKLRIRWI